MPAVSFRKARPYLWVLIGLGGLVWFREEQISQGRPPPGARTPPPAPKQDRPVAIVHAPNAHRDVTFLAISDTHVGYVADNIETAVVERINTIAGHDYPPEIGGRVDTPRGLIITGDLTESGTAEQFSRFLKFYGSTTTQPSAAGLTIPAYEVVGNHDSRGGLIVADQVAARHGGKPYSFDLDDIHFDALGEAPDDNALDWLEQDLARYESSVPMVVYFHLALEGPWSKGDWFAGGDYKDRLEKILAGRCVIGIIHGHHHETDHYIWHGFDVYKPGAVKHDAHTFAVFHVKDDDMTAAYFHYDRLAWVWSQKKKICQLSPDPEP